MKLFWPQLNLIIMFDFISFFFLFSVFKKIQQFYCVGKHEMHVYFTWFFLIPLPVLKPNLYFSSINFFQCDQGYRLFRSQSRYISMLGACIGKKHIKDLTKTDSHLPRITRAIDQPSPAAQRFGLLHLCDQLPDNCAREVVVF